MGKDVKRQERGRREGRKGCRVCALRGPLQRGMLALPHFCSPLQGVLNVATHPLLLAKSLSSVLPSTVNTQGHCSGEFMSCA